MRNLAKPRGSGVDGDGRGADFHEIMLGEHGFESGEVDGEEPAEGVVGNVAGGNQQELAGLAAQEKPGDKIPVLGDDDTVFRIGQGNDHVVRCAVAGGQVEGVDGVVAGRGQLANEVARELGIHQEFHGRTGSMRWTRLRRAP